MKDNFEAKYPNIAGWVQDGWIEIGRTDFSTSFIRVIDEGGTVWEGKEHYPSISVAFDEAEEAISQWLEENG